MRGNGHWRAGTRGQPLSAVKANVRLGSRCLFATVKMAMTDIGTGTYTILAQITSRCSVCRWNMSGSNSAIPASASVVGRVDSSRSQFRLGTLPGLQCVT